MDVEEDNEAAWNNWDVESDSDSDSSGDWIAVDSDGSDQLSVSDSDSEGEKDDKEIQTPSQEHPEAEKRISSLATTKVRIKSSSRN